MTLKPMYPREIQSQLLHLASEAEAARHNELLYERVHQRINRYIDAWRRARLDGSVDSRAI